MHLTQPANTLVLMLIISMIYLTQFNTTPLRTMCNKYFVYTLYNNSCIKNILKFCSHMRFCIQSHLSRKKTTQVTDITIANENVHKLLFTKMNSSLIQQQLLLHSILQAGRQRSRWRLSSWSVSVLSPAKCFYIDTAL